MDEWDQYREMELLELQELEAGNQMDDMSYLDTLADIDRELRGILDEYNLRALGLVGKATLCGLRLEQNERLAVVVAKHNRILRYHLGETVEPLAHPAEAVLMGVLGGDAG